MRPHRRNAIRAAVAAALLFLALSRSPAQSAADRAGVDAFNRALADATRRMDNAASMALWADDGVSLLPSASALVGKKAIADYLAAVTARIAGSRMEQFEIRCFDIEIAGPLASEWCVEHQIVRLANGDRFNGWGKMAFVLRRGADGTWRLKQETWIQGVATDSALVAGNSRPPS